MQIAIFGASGKTGRVIAAAALSRGHTVSALVRKPESAALDARIRVVRGDVREAPAVRDVVSSADAVISALGAPLHVTFTAEGRVGTYGMPAILEAMTLAGVRRLLVLSAYFAGESRAKLSTIGRALTPIVMHGESADKEEMERLVRASTLDWTIVRPTNLADKPATGRVIEEPSGPIGMSSWINRADVADFMLRIVAEPAYFRRAVLITG